MLACPLAVKHAVLEAWDAFPFSVPAPRKCQHFCWEVLHTHKPSGGCLGCWHDSLQPLQSLEELSEARPCLNYPQIQCLAWGLEKVCLKTLEGRKIHGSIYPTSGRQQARKASWRRQAGCEHKPMADTQTARGF